MFRWPSFSEYCCWNILMEAFLRLVGHFDFIFFKLRLCKLSVCGYLCGNKLSARVEVVSVAMDFELCWAGLTDQGKSHVLAASESQHAILCIRFVVVGCCCILWICMRLSLRRSCLAKLSSACIRFCVMCYITSWTLSGGGGGGWDFDIHQSLLVHVCVISFWCYL